MTIINIRGTHGSGKSTVVKRVLERYGSTRLGNDKKPEGYRVDLPWGKQLYVVGSYETACGGCDAIQPYSLIWPRVVEYAQLGHVLFEGALVSSSYGNIGRASEEYGDQFVFAFMTTPLEVCLQRIAARRLARGDTRPLNPKNTEGKLRSIQGSLPKIIALGRRVVMLDYRHPLPQLLGLLLHA